MTAIPPAPSRRLDALPGYGRGRAGQTVSFRHRLGSNEAPDGPSPAVQAAVASALAGAHRYPDLRGESLAAALARRHGLWTPSRYCGRGRVHRAARPVDPGLVRSRRRGRERLAIVRGLSDPGRSGRRPAGRGAAGLGGTHRRAGDGGGRRAAHAHGPDLQSEQPDRHGTVAAGRSTPCWPRCRPRCWSSWTRPMPITQAKPADVAASARGSAGAARQPCGPAHLLEGVGSGRAAGRLLPCRSRIIAARPRRAPALSAARSLCWRRRLACS
jgi:hypothetical protein